MGKEMRLSLAMFKLTEPFKLFNEYILQINNRNSVVMLNEKGIGGQRDQLRESSWLINIPHQRGH